MAAKRTTPKSPQSVPDTSGDFDGVLRRMLEMPPTPRVTEPLKKAKKTEKRRT
jgi:hypothetical protein